MTKKVLKVFSISDYKITKNGEISCKGDYIDKKYFIKTIKEGIKKGVIPKTYVVVLEGERKDDEIFYCKPLKIFTKE